MSAGCPDCAEIRSLFLGSDRFLERLSLLKRRLQDDDEILHGSVSGSVEIRRLGGSDFNVPNDMVGPVIDQRKFEYVVGFRPKPNAGLPENEHGDSSSLLVSTPSAEHGSGALLKSAPVRKDGTT